MKKKILSPLCSALIIPGFGQVINGNLKKGLGILGMVFLLFLGGTVKLIFIIRSYLKHPEIMPDASGVISETRHIEDFSSLLYVVVAFAMLWVYSVFDAFWTAKKQEREVQVEDNTL